MKYPNIKRIKTHWVLTFLLLGATSSIMAQSEAFLDVGVGPAFTKGNISQLQTSLGTYATYAQNSWPSDAIDKQTELKSNVVSPAWVFQGGVIAESFILGMTYSWSKISQEADIWRESGYGRSFYWEERRNDVLVDFGFNKGKISVYGSVGSNFNNFSMASYQRYPNGTKSLDKQFTNNGLFRAFDAGLSYGAGVKWRPIKFISVDFRYYKALDNLIGEAESDVLTLTDNSFSRTPGTTEFPADWTKPKSFSNSISPDFNRRFLVLSFSAHIPIRI